MNDLFFSPGGPGPNGQTLGALHLAPAESNGTPQAHGTPPGANRHIPPLGVPRPRMIAVPFRPGYGPAPGGPHFFPRGPTVGLHGDR